MSLVSCRECGHQVSTQAPACPQCGTAPPSIASRPVSRGFAISVSVVAAAFALVGIWAFSLPDAPKRQAPSPVAAVVAPAAPARPSHYYTWYRGGFYGYELEQTEFAREHGAAPPAIRFWYEGQRGGAYHLRQFNGSFIDAVSCALPCKDVRIVNAQVDQVMPLRAGTPLWAAVQDMLAGELKPTQ